MKLLFKNKRQSTEQKGNRLSKAVYTLYERIQSVWAEWMAKSTKNFSRATWKVILTLFVLCGGSYSIYLAMDGFTTKRSKSFSVTRIKKPQHLTKSRDIGQGSSLLPKAEYERIKKFRIYMDSLARSPSGKILYDSITRHHPGLMDSVWFIENYYGQLKHK